MPVEVTGLREALMALEGMSERAADLTIAMQQSAEVIKDGALERWPVVDRSGKLKRSIMLRVGKTSAKVVVAAKHARYLQYGKRVQPHRILLDPTEAEITEARELIAGHVMGDLGSDDIAAVRRVVKRR